ncbi:MAG TPA: VOC family protein [Solirubrobacteraceae bacterium]|jgi:catechol 2,3-dioxygenase|nr:VOC family protein [Solirubrobacteraceae bacterium]
MAPIDPNLRIGSVQLDVSDLARSADFYQRVLGLPLISSEQHLARLGPDPLHPALVLGDIAHPTPLPPGATGLYHVAWLHPSRAALAESVRRVAATRWPFEGASDHGVSEALYLSDPDGLGIELYADRPREQWQRPADGHGVNMVTLPLDLDDLLAQYLDEPAPVVSPDTGIGHVHMKVSHVPRAADFYRDAIGLDEQAQLPSAAFLAAGGYHHHVGLNSWQSQGAAPAPDSAPGLRRIEFQLSDPQALDALERTLANASSQPSPARRQDGELSVRDPDGQLLAFVQG